MKLLVAIPCMDMMHTKFVDSLIRAFKDYPEATIEFGASSLIYDTRNQFIAKALDGGYDRIMWIDSDMVFDASAIAYLNEDLDRGYGIVCGLYFKRRPPYTPTIYRDCALVTDDQGRLLPTVEVIKDFPEDKLFQVAAFGFAGVMMDVKALQKIVDKYGKLLFMPYGGFGEDLSFCLRARMAEVNLYCDSRATFGHVGEHIYCIDDFRRESHANES